MASLVVAKKSSPSRSCFQKTVTLLDWWLTKPETDHGTKTLGVGGLTCQQGQAARCFSSAPIIKMHNLFQLETADGVFVILQGFINRDRTLENEFSPEVFDHFYIGFPPNWMEFSTSCPKTECAANTRVQEEDGKDRIADFPGESQNCDSSTVDKGVEDCKEIMLGDKTSTPLNPLSDGIPQEHVVGAGVEVLCESSPGFMDDPSREMNTVASHLVDSSTRSKSLGNRSTRMTRSMKKKGISKNDSPLVNDTSSNLDKATLGDPGILGSSVNGGCEKETGSCAENVVSEKKSKRKQIDQPVDHVITKNMNGRSVNGGREKETGSCAEEVVLEKTPKQKQIDQHVDPVIAKDMKGCSLNGGSEKKIGSCAEEVVLKKKSKRKQIDQHADPVIAKDMNGSSVNGGREKETGSCAEEVVLEKKSKRKQIDQRVDHVITKDMNDADVSGDPRVDTSLSEENITKSRRSDTTSNKSVGEIDVNGDDTRTNMKGCVNKKKTRVDILQKGVSSTPGISSKEAEATMTRSKSKTKLPVKRKLIESPESAKSTPSRGKKDRIAYGSEEKRGSADIVSLDSFSGKKSRSGRVILPRLEYWRNQIIVYGKDGHVSGVQDPK